MSDRSRPPPGDGQRGPEERAGYAAEKARLLSDPDLAEDEREVLAGALDTLERLPPPRAAPIARQIQHMAYVMFLDWRALELQMDGVDTRFISNAILAGSRTESGDEGP